MKLYVFRTMNDHKGQMITTGEGENSPARLGDICVQALLMDTPQDTNADMTMKVRKWNMARQIQKKMEEKFEDMAFVEMPAEDISFIQKRIGMTFKTTIVGPAINALEG